MAVYGHGQKWPMEGRLWRHPVLVLPQPPPTASPRTCLVPSLSPTLALGVLGAVRRMARRAMSSRGYADLLDQMNDAAAEGNLEVVQRHFQAALSVRKGSERQMAYKLFRKAAANAGDLELAEQRFAEMLQDGCRPNTKTYGKLIEAAARVGDPGRALHWFNELQSSFALDLDHYNMMAQAFFVAGDLQSGAHWLFSEAPKGGFRPDIVGYNQYLDALSAHGLVEDAWALMAQAQAARVTPNVSSYNSLINVCAKSSSVESATEAFTALKDAKLQPDAISFNSVLDGMARAGDVQAADQWLQQMWQAAVQPDVVSCASFMRAAAPQARSHWLKTLREHRAALDIWAYAAVMDACAQAGDSKGAVRWHREAQQEQLHPDVVTYNCLINACAKRGDSHAAERWLIEMMQSRISPELISFNSVLKACKGKSSNEVVPRMFQAMASWSMQPDLISFNSALAASISARHSSEEIVQWIGAMRQQSLAPDGTTFTTVMQAADDSLEQAEAWFGWLLKAGGEPNCAAYANIIALCQQAKQVDRAEEWMKRCLASAAPGDLRAPFLQMLRGRSAGRWLEMMKTRSIDPGIQGYTSVIASCAYAGDAKAAQFHFSEMQAASFQPDLKSYGALMTAFVRAQGAQAALETLQEVQDRSLQADGKMYHQVLAALGKAPALRDQVGPLFRQLVARGIQPGSAAFGSLKTALGSEEGRRICAELGVNFPSGGH